MKRKDMQTLFDAMRGIVRMTDTQMSYGSKEWSEYMSLWCGVFAADTYEHVWAGVRMYIHNGGIFWPLPGEVADLMPEYDVDADALRNLRYTTRAAARAAQKDISRHRRSPFVLYGARSA